MALHAFLTTAKKEPRRNWTHRRMAISCSVMALVILSAGCKGDGPTTPTTTPLSSSNPTTPSAMPLPSNGEAFEVTGVVTDEQGVPVAGADVTMAHSLGGRDHRPFVRTDASGRYTITFTS